MISLIQRVSVAEVRVAGVTVAKIDGGLLALVGIERGDDDDKAQKMAQKLLNYRIFPDEEARMNRNVCETGGGVLLVSQFTLAANTRKGNRPGFDPAMPPAAAEPFFARFVEMVRARYSAVQCGRFGAEMQVALVNDGPVTFWLQT